MKPLSTIRKTNEMAKIWALTDDRMGNISQVLGVAEALDEEYERKEIKYNVFVKLPNFLRGRSLCGVSKESRTELTAPWPGLVIAAGRRLFPVARFIKKKSGNKTKIVPRVVTSGLKHVGVRIPDNEIACRISNLFPVTTTSANLSDHEVCETPDEILDQLNHDVDLVIDVGKLKRNKPSTIINLTSEKPIILER